MYIRSSFLPFLVLPSFLFQHPDESTMVAGDGGIRGEWGWGGGGGETKPSRLIIIIDGRRVRVRDYDKSTTGYSEFITRLARMRFRSRSSYSHKFEKESGFWKGAHRILYERCTRGSLGVVVAFDQSSSPHGNKNIGEKRRHGRSVSSWFHSYTIGVPPFFEIQ